MKSHPRSKTSSPRHLLKDYFKNRFLLYLLLGFFIVISLFTYQDFGVAIDEPMEYSFGQLLYNRYFGKDPQLIRDFAIESPTSREIWSHNHFHAMLLYIVNDTGDLATYHLLNLLFGVVGLYVAFEILYLATKDTKLSLIGPLLLITLPRFSGDLPSNVKDPVFAIYYLIGLYAIIMESKIKTPILRLLILGISFGFAAAMRSLGYSLLFIYGLYHLAHLVSVSSLKLHTFSKTVFKLALIFLIMIVIHGIHMPFVAANPLTNLPRLFEIARDFPWEGAMRYLGQEVTAGHLPWHYPLIWGGVTIPVFTLAFWFISHRFIKQNKPLAILALAFWFNLLLYYLLQPVIYDGIRHLLFLTVIIAVMASISWVLMFRSSHPKMKVILAALLTFHLFSIFKQYRELHPYEYVYFNQLVGHLSGAQQQFETDYWGTSYYEASRWLIEHLDHNQVKVIGLCGNEYSRVYFDSTPHQVVWLPNCDQIESHSPDYIISMARNNEWTKVPGHNIYTISRQNVPLAKIFQLNQ